MGRWCSSPVTRTCGLLIWRPAKRANLTNTPDRVEIDGRWWPANPGKIVFGSWDAAEEIYISAGYLSMISTDGSDYQILDGETASIAPPALSPDGRTIAYDRGGTAWLYRLDTGPELFDPAVYGLEAPKGITLGSPAWSPDGGRLAWWAGGGFGEGGDWALTVAVFDLQTQTVQRAYTYSPVGGSDGWLPTPVWSPDGRWLAVTTRGEQDRVNLWVVSADGAERFPLGRSESPVWRPDSQALVFSRWIEGESLYQDTQTILVTLGDWVEEQLFLPSGTYPQAWLTGGAVYQGTAEPWFSPQISFGASPDAALPQRAFPAGTKQVYAPWSYANMRDGMTVRQEWVLDGGILQTQEEPWDFARHGASGVFQEASVSDMENGLAPGTYQLRLYIDGQEQTVQEDPVAASFTISAPLEVPAQTAPDGSRVALVERAWDAGHPGFQRPARAPVFGDGNLQPGVVPGQRKFTVRGAREQRAAGGCWAVRLRGEPVGCKRRYGRSLPDRHHGGQYA